MFTQVRRQLVPLRLSRALTLVGRFTISRIDTGDLLATFRRAGFRVRQHSAWRSCRHVGLFGGNFSASACSATRCRCSG